MVVLTVPADAEPASEVSIHLTATADATALHRRLQRRAESLYRGTASSSFNHIDIIAAGVLSQPADDLAPVVWPSRREPGGRRPGLRTGGEGRRIAGSARRPRPGGVVARSGARRVRFPRARVSRVRRRRDQLSAARVPSGSHGTVPRSGAKKASRRAGSARAACWKGSRTPEHAFWPLAPRSSPSWTTAILKKPKPGICRSYSRRPGDRRDRL